MSFKSELTVDVIDTHTEGEPTRIIFWNSIPKNLPDALSVRNYFIQHYDYIRTTLLQEPRPIFHMNLTPKNLQSS